MAAKPTSPKQEVQVTRKIVQVSPALGETKDVYRITYWSKDIPPRTLWIDEDKWSEKAEAEAIRKDIEARKAETSKTVSV